MFLGGSSTGAGALRVSTVKHFYPCFKLGGRSKLQRAEEFMKGWRRAQPLLARLPAPRKVMAVLAGRVVYKGFRRAASGLWLGLEAYIWPGELAGLRQ